MKLIVPNYYPQFRCIADKCRHSCCIGWEIDIDPVTREKFRCVPGEFGQRLNAAIDDSGEASCFRLGPNERCPMLNKSGLCDLITELGEGALCQICADHPRFRNFFGDRTEIGLGLCCEEAARLILTQQEPMRLIELEDDGGQEKLDDVQTAVLNMRGLLIAIMQDRRASVTERLQRLLNTTQTSLPLRTITEWADIYRGLERLDPAWDAALDSLRESPDAPLPEGLETAFEQFAVYLLYRHYPGLLEDGDSEGRVKFTVLSVTMLMCLCAAHAARHGSCTLEDCCEYARMYSAEIEYSEDNIAALLDALWEEE
ncbi:MAG: flagellin lysine-N-methylase [Clostridia bacterium]|nr:flagellin lysine-N-methylase [Clostridia bacterium]